MHVRTAQDDFDSGSQFCRMKRTLKDNALLRWMFRLIERVVDNRKVIDHPVDLFAGAGGQQHFWSCVIDTNRQIGMCSLDNAIAEKYFNGLISREDAIAQAAYPDKLERQLAA